MAERGAFAGRAWRPPWGRPRAPCGARGASQPVAFASVHQGASLGRRCGVTPSTYNRCAQVGDCSVRRSFAGDRPGYHSERVFAFHNFNGVTADVNVENLLTLIVRTSEDLAGRSISTPCWIRTVWPDLYPSVFDHVAVPVAAMIYFVIM